jgi:hypothetical protein
MSTQFTNLFELNLTTLLNNILDLLDNRLKALDIESNDLDSNEPIKLSESLKLAMRACAEENSKRELIQSIQEINIFYTKFQCILNEKTTQRLEKRYIMHVKNKIIKAMTETMAKYDAIAIDGYKDVVGKHNIIKNSINADPSILSKFKKRSEKHE